MATTEDLATQFLALTDAKDWGGREALVGEDCEFVSPSGVLRGRAATTAFSQGFVGAFSDAGHRLDTIVSDGDVGVIEGVWSGTHTEPLVTPGGNVPPTGKRVDLPFAAMFRAEDGQVTSIRIYFDQLGFMAQLGLLPQPATA